ncbi:hypothetical protein [Sicyoidochytrium minutum DNA virus]|nr:hypothetical protein [Sicyoidochytrium minutum DNA virus]
MILSRGKIGGRLFGVPPFPDTNNFHLALITVLLDCVFLDRKKRTKSGEFDYQRP